MKNKLVELLKKHNLTLGSIESLTGGLFASTITSVSGVSSVFKGTVVTYFTEIKEKVVGVKKETISKYGVISKECALEMATYGQKLIDTDVIVSFTGNAGPSVMEDKEVGKVFIGIIIKKEVEVLELNLTGDRNEIRNKCVEIALNKIFEKINRLF